MGNYKRKVNFRPKRLDFSIDAKLTSKGKKYRISVANLSKSDIIASREPAKWLRYRINNNCVLLHTTATASTDFQMEGEPVTMLKFKDGRTLRIYQQDLRVKDFRYLMRLLCDIYGVNRNKSKRKR